MMVDLIVIYRIVFEPTGESYVGSYTRGTDIAASGRGRLPGLGLSQTSPWAKRFSAPFTWRACRWERIDCFPAHKKRLADTKKAACIADDIAENPASMHRKTKPHVSGVGARGGHMRQVVAAVKEKPAKSGDIAELLGWETGRTRTTIGGAVVRGYIQRLPDGRYGVTELGKTNAA